MGLCINFQFKLSTFPFHFQVLSPFIFCCSVKKKLLIILIWWIILCSSGCHHPCSTTMVLEMPLLQPAGSRFAGCDWALQDPPQHLLPAGSLSFAGTHPWVCQGTCPGGQPRAAACAPQEAECHTTAQFNIFQHIIPGWFVPYPSPNPVFHHKLHQPS